MSLFVTHSARSPWLRPLLSACCLVGLTYMGILPAAAQVETPAESASPESPPSPSVAPNSALPAEVLAILNAAIRKSDDSRKDREAGDKPEPKPYAETLEPYYAILIGALGSFAYLLAVWVGLVGRDDHARERILEHIGKHPLLAGISYLGCGGGVAMVFQLQEAKLVPVQAFILGCTWPAVVTNYLSARQSGLTEDEARKKEEIKVMLADALKVEQAKEAVPAAKVLPDAAVKLDELGDILKNLG